MPSFQRIRAVTLLALLSGCANQIRIRADYDHTAHFSGWKTYAWAPGAQTGLDDPRLNAAFIDPQVRADVNRELAAKGYVQGSPAQADFLMSYHVNMENRSGAPRASDGPLYSGYAVTFQDGEVTRGLYQDPMAVSELDIYRVGTLILRITNPQTQKPVWNGGAQARLADNSPLAKKQQRLKEAIHLILDKFPPK